MKKLIPAVMLLLFIGLYLRAETSQTHETIPEISLGQLSDVSTDTAVSGQALTFNGVDWIGADMPQGAAGSGLVYFLDDTDSGIAGYSMLLTTPVVTTPEDVDTGVLGSAGIVLIDSYTSIPINRTYIPAGEWTSNMFAFVDTIVNTSELILEFSTRSAGGFECLLTSVTTGDINFTTSTLFITKFVLGRIDTSLTDRIVLKVYGQTSRPAGASISFTHNGTEHYSNFVTPIVVTDDTKVSKSGDTMTGDLIAPNFIGTRVSTFSLTFETGGDMYVSSTTFPGISKFGIQSSSWTPTSARIDVVSYSTDSIITVNFAIRWSSAPDTYSYLLTSPLTIQPTSYQSPVVTGFAFPTIAMDDSISIHVLRAGRHDSAGDVSNSGATPPSGFSGYIKGWREVNQ